MPRIAPKKCITCSQLAIAQVLELHGASGDHCWNPQVCHAKRTYYRHRPKYVESKWQRRHSPPAQPGSTPDIPARKDEAQELEVKLPDYAIALMQLYRTNASTDVHAVGAQLWVGGKLVTSVRPIHTLGMTEGQVKNYLRQVLKDLSQQHGVELTGFGSQVTLDPKACPLDPCPLSPEAR